MPSINLKHKYKYKFETENMIVFANSKAIKVPDKKKLQKVNITVKQLIEKYHPDNYHYQFFKDYVIINKLNHS